MLGRQKARAPEAVEEALLGVARLGVHHHVVRQVVIHAAEAIAQPGPQARPTGHLTAGLDVGDGRIMIDRLGEGGVHHAEFLHHASGVRQQFAHPHAVGIVVVLGEAILARRERQTAFLVGRHSGDPLPVADMIRQLLAKLLLHRRLVVPHVVLTGAAAHEEVDHMLCLGCMVQARLGSRSLVSHNPLLSQQLRQRGRPQPQRRLTKKMPPRQRGSEISLRRMHHSSAPFSSYC